MLADGLTDADLEVAADPVFAAMLHATLAESASQALAGYAEDIDCFRAHWTPTLRSLVRSITRSRPRPSGQRGLD
jgi:hypothetical protein